MTTITEGQALTARTTIPITLGRLRRKGIDIATGVITVGELHPLVRVARRDPITAVGYQRKPSPARVRQLAHSLDVNRVDLPTALLLNIRDFDRDTGLVNGAGGPGLKLGPEPIWIVDGQHRWEALRSLYEPALQARDDKAIDKWRSYSIPFVCMLGADEFQEMEQFYVVNTYAKSVRTDLAYDILKTRAETDPGVIQELIEAGKDWIPTGQELAQRLSSSALWRGRIRFPNQASEVTTISSSGMVNSFKPLLATAFFQRLKIEGQVKIVQTYWDGIQRVLPEAFSPDPKGFSLQRSLGVQVMHRLMVDVIEVLRAQGKDVTDPDAYADALRDPLTNLSGESLDQGTVSGVDFWRTGHSGAAAPFSSNAGRRVLVSQLRRELPKFDLA